MDQIAGQMADRTSDQHRRQRIYVAPRAALPAVFATNLAAPFSAPALRATIVASSCVKVSSARIFSTFILLFLFYRAEHPKIKHSL
jgi:hypothetical protein